MKPQTIIALLSGPDQPGLVSRVSSWIFLRGSNIHHADQHKDQEANIFFQRVEWAPTGQIDEEAAAFKKFASEELGMEEQVDCCVKQCRRDCQGSSMENVISTRDTRDDFGLR